MLADCLKLQRGRGPLKQNHHIFSAQKHKIFHKIDFIPEATYSATLAFAILFTVEAEMKHLNVEVSGVFHTPRTQTFLISLVYFRKFMKNQIFVLSFAP